MSAQGKQLRTELRAEMAAEGAQSRLEIRDGDEDARRYSRVMHEEVMDRLKTIQEGMPKSPRR